MLSFFELQTRAIPRDKGGAQVEFSLEVVLNNEEGGIVTPYGILEHQNEQGQVVEAVTHDQEHFVHPPGR